MWHGISQFLPSWPKPKPTEPPVGNVTGNNTSTQPQDINDSATPGHGNLNGGLQTPDNIQCDTPHDSDQHSTCSGCFKDEDDMASSTQTLVNLGFSNNNGIRGAYTNEDHRGYSEPARNYDHNTVQPQLGENNQNTTPTARDSGLDSAEGPLSEEVNGSELQPPPFVGVDISNTNMHPKRVDINDRGHAFTSGNNSVQQDHKRITTSNSKPNLTPNRPENETPFDDNNWSMTNYDMIRVGQSVGWNYMGHAFTMENEYVEQNRVDVDLSGVRDAESMKAILSVVMSANTSTPNNGEGVSGRQR